MNSTQHKTNKVIIELVESIVKPQFTFHMDDFYGDRGGIPYPDIEDLDTLHFKYDGRRYWLLSEQEKEELVKKIKNKLSNNNVEIENIEIVKYQYFGLFIKIVLPKYNEMIINLYDEYQNYRNTNAEKINSVYCYLEKKIPEEFVGWCLFNQNKK